jgi:hypothetical protein
MESEFVSQGKSSTRFRVQRTRSRPKSGRNSTYPSSSPIQLLREQAGSHADPRSARVRVRRGEDIDGVAYIQALSRRRDRIWEPKPLRPARQSRPAEMWFTCRLRRSNFGAGSRPLATNVSCHVTSDVQRKPLSGQKLRWRRRFRGNWRRFPPSPQWVEQTLIAFPQNVQVCWIFVGPSAVIRRLRDPGIAPEELGRDALSTTWHLVKEVSSAAITGVAAGYRCSERCIKLLKKAHPVP